MNVLIFGSSSFAGKNLAARLEAAGHSVTEFNRGAPGRNGSRVSGSISSLTDNPYWPSRVDVIVNYTLLKDETVEENVAFCAQLIALAKSLGCPRLIHLSSISAYAMAETVISEESRIEPDAAKKGAYGALKVATENYLRDNADGVSVTFLRPGFILGDGLVSATVGMGAKLPGGKLLILGNAEDTVPVTTRSLVDEAIERLIDRAGGHGEAFLIADSRSPTKGDYLGFCASSLGVAKSTLQLPPLAWLGIGAGAQGLLTVAGKGNVKVWQKISSLTEAHRYDSGRTETALGMSLACDWQRELGTSFDGQPRNYEFAPLPRSEALDSLPSLLLLGCGRIVQQKHLPALKAAGFRGRLQVFDPFLKVLPETGLATERLDDPRTSDAALVVVATPGRQHVEALAQLPDSARLVMLEKPVAYGVGEMEQWRTRQAETGLKVGAFHNYRLKPNVVRLHQFLQSHNSGELMRANVTFDSPPVANDGVRWARRERQVKTLLYDYGLHFLDLGCLFGQEYAGVEDVAWHINQRGETADISGAIALTNYKAYFQLRQGYGTQRTQIEFVFANYVARLTFFPDTLSIITGRDSFVDRLAEFGAQGGATLQKVADKLTKRDADHSHQVLYQDAMASLNGDGPPALSLDRLAPTYRILNDVSEQVYSE